MMAGRIRRGNSAVASTKYLLFVPALLVLAMQACVPAKLPSSQPAAALAVSSPSSQPASSQPPACTDIGQQWLAPLDGVTLLCVPAGEFVMGAASDDPKADDDEKPPHSVYLAAFWIDRTEVTNANFARCMADGACRPRVYGTEYGNHPAYQDYPALVYEVEDALAYCSWAGRRLPDEAEWEKAARGTDGRIFPWGDSLDCSRASYYDCEETGTQDRRVDLPPACGYRGECRTVPVDSYLSGASPYGALNMAGNAWEWVGDWYAPDYYASSPASNPAGPESGAFRVRRGGGCTSLPQDLRVTARASGQPHHYFDGQMGFRCAMDSPDARLFTE
jgi:formylglycine-generating enzyme required for sulfatase activity